MDYQKIYNQIIERAKTRQLEGYKEKHHITPKCVGGSNEKSNLVELTAREHFLCHMLLCEIYPKEGKLKQALWLMSINKNKKNHQKYKVSSKEYERIKKENSIIVSSYIKKLKKNHICYRNPKRGEKISKSLTGYKQNKEHLNKRKIANSKPIIQYNLDGTPLKEWISCTEASNFLNINIRGINNNLLNISKSSGGYIWKFKN
jgi:hypothetical protein